MKNIKKTTFYCHVQSIAKSSFSKCFYWMEISDPYIAWPLCVEWINNSDTVKVLYHLLTVWWYHLTKISEWVSEEVIKSIGLFRTEISSFQICIEDWYLEHLLWNCLSWMPLYFTDDMPTLVQAMAWCHQTAITWARVDSDLCGHMASLGHNKSPYGITRPQQVALWHH